MKNLRYLNLQGISKITTLPDSFEQLTKLQILNLRGCDHLERLPNVIQLLKNLTHLDVSECPFLETMPQGLGSLSKLQVLKGFVLNNKVHDSCRLSELTDLKKLQKLSIKALTQEREPIDMKELKNFSPLHSLTINWAEKVKSHLTFPPELEKLDLQRIPQSELCNWQSPENLRKLKKLYIRGGELKSLALDPEGENWNVETLRLRFLKELECRDWYELKTAFPSLAFIEIRECPKLEAIVTSVPLGIYVDRVLITKKRTLEHHMRQLQQWPEIQFFLFSALLLCGIVKKD